jgi:hypothetical protein
MQRRDGGQHYLLAVGTERSKEALNRGLNSRDRVIFGTTEALPFQHGSLFKGSQGTRFDRRNVWKTADWEW